MWNLVCLYLLFFILLACGSKKDTSTKKPFISNDPVLSKLETDSDGAVSIQKLLDALPSKSKSKPEPVSNNEVSSSLIEEQQENGENQAVDTPPPCSDLSPSMHRFSSITKDLQKELYSAGICVVQEEKVDLDCIAKYIYNRCLRPSARRREKDTHTATCKEQGGDSFSVTHNWYNSDFRYDGLSCDTIDSRDNQPLLYAIDLDYYENNCLEKWDQIKRVNSYRCSDDRYVTFHNGYRFKKLKVSLNGKDVSVSGGKCIRVPVNDLHKISVTRGEEEICKPTDERNCLRFYMTGMSKTGHSHDGRGDDYYGWNFYKSSIAFAGLPPYRHNIRSADVYSYKYAFRRNDYGGKGCKGIND